MLEFIDIDVRSIRTVTRYKGTIKDFQKLVPALGITATYPKKGGLIMLGTNKQIDLIFNLRTNTIKISKWKDGF